MKKFLLFSMLVMSGSAFSLQENCSITCYEKTPTCYVTTDKSGCIKLSYQKPKCGEKACTCVIKGCDTKTTFENGNSVTTTKKEGKTQTKVSKEIQN
ncbi:MAG: hypothetical protein ACYCQI_16755 [Gammaproteobacteria bacterium]